MSTTQIKNSAINTSTSEYGYSHSPDAQEKLEFLYQTYRKLMMRIALNILNNPVDAEDAVQQSFLNITETIDTVDISVEPKIKGFLVKVIRNQALDMKNLRINYPLADASDCGAIEMDYQDRYFLNDCIARLPEHYRSVLLMKYYYGYTTREIACKVHSSEANVHKQIQRSKAKLKYLCEMGDMIF